MGISPTFLSEIPFKQKEGSTLNSRTGWSCRRSVHQPQCGSSRGWRGTNWHSPQQLATVSFSLAIVAPKPSHTFSAHHQLWLSLLWQGLWQGPACYLVQLGVRRKLLPMAPPSLSCASLDCIPQTAFCSYVVVKQGRPHHRVVQKFFRIVNCVLTSAGRWGPKQDVPPDLLSAPGKSLIFIIKMIKHSK